MKKSKSAIRSNHAKGFQPKSDQVKELESQLQAANEVIHAAAVRFRQTYPSTQLEDWKELLASEAVMLVTQNLKSPLPHDVIEEMFLLDEERQQRGIPGIYSTGLECETVDRQHQALVLAADFISTFEIVFNQDWDYTKNAIAQAVADVEAGKEDLICGEKGSFAYPVIDNPRQWNNRNHLLQSYYKLRTLLEESGVLESSVFWQWSRLAGQQPYLEISDEDEEWEFSTEDEFDVSDEFFENF